MHYHPCRAVLTTPDGNAECLPYNLQKNHAHGELVTYRFLETSFHSTKLGIKGSQ